MQKQFEKGSREWEFFARFYKLVQQYYIVEEANGPGYANYWKPMMSDFHKLGAEYKDCGLLSKFCFAYVDACDRLLNEKEG